MFERARQKVQGQDPVLPAPRRLELACASDTGLCREHNEDNFLFGTTVMPQEHQSLEGVLTARESLSKPVVAAVLDGMGGEPAGETASYVAAQRLAELAPSLEADEPNLQHAFRAMQDAVRAMRINRRLSTTGTTAVVLASHGNVACVGNLGDSPAFLLRGGELRTLSVAHTDERLLRQLGIARRPGLTQFLGIDEGDAPIEPHIVSFELAAGDRILLASDGLTDMVDEAVIAHAMQSAASVEALACTLRDQALANGGEDNVTIIACEVLA